MRPSHSTVDGFLIGRGLVAGMAIGLLTTTLWAAPEENFQERLQFDPATGEWIELAPPVPGTEEGDLALGRSLLARGRFAEAREAFADWFKLYPGSEHWPEALFYAAETEVSAEDAKPRSGHLIKAYGWLEELLEGWPGGELNERAIRKEMIIAEMLLFKGRKQKVFKGMLHLSAKEEALSMLDRIIDDWAHGSPLGEQALRLKADYHYINGEFEEAETAYARLARDFPRGRYEKIAMLRSGEAAFARFPGVEFDDADLLEAEVYLSDFKARYPQSAEENNVPQLLARITETKAQKDFLIARYYEKTKATGAAVYYYRQIEKNYPATTWGAESRNRLIDLGAIDVSPGPPEETAYEEPPLEDSTEIAPELTAEENPAEEETPTAEEETPADDGASPR